MADFARSNPLSCSAVARGRAGHDAHAAFGRRGLRGAAGFYARAQVWQRQGKVSPAFSKAAVGKAEPYGLTRRSRKRKAGQRPHGAQRIGRGPGAEAPYLSFPQSIAPGAVSVPPCLLFPQAKLRSLGQNNRGTYVPPFFVYGKAVASPPHPCKVLGFHPKPHKPFEKGLSENFTFLHPTQARGRYVPVGRCPAADRAGRRDKG